RKHRGYSMVESGLPARKKARLRSLRDLDGRTVAARRFLDGARVLIERGLDPALLAVMVRENGIESLSAPLGVAAGLTVESSRFGPPFFLLRHKQKAGAEPAPPVAQPDGGPA